MAQADALGVTTSGLNMRVPDNASPPETADVLARVPGAAQAARRIRNETTRKAFKERLRTAIALKLSPQLISLGKETAFAFGPERYPLCRINTGKGIAFHGHRHVKPLIIRGPGDHAFRLATGQLRRLSLSLMIQS